MRQYLFFLLFLFLQSSPSLRAQAANSLLFGYLKTEKSRLLRLEINKRYFNNRTEEYQVLCNASGSFSLRPGLEFPQLINLRYQNQELQLLLGPGDSLGIELDADLQVLRFFGRGAADNRLWQAWRKYRFWEQAPFAYQNYRKGIHEFGIHYEDDPAMRRLAAEPYLQELQRAYTQDLEVLEDYLRAEMQSVSPSAQQFIRTEIESRFIYLLAAYTQIYANKHRIDSAFLGQVLAQRYEAGIYQNDSALGHTLYRQALLAQSYYYSLDMPLEAEQVPEARPYYWAAEHLQGLSRAYCQAHWLSQALRKHQPKACLALYEDFLEKNPYIEFDRIVTELFHKEEKQAVGAPAPLFSLPDSTGTMVQIQSFRGRVVYLYFWASWCKPCISKLRALQQYIPALEAARVALVFVSLDKDRDAWLRCLAREGFGGALHLIEREHSLVAPAYELLSVPRSFILDKEGKFAPAAQEQGLEALSQYLLELQGKD